ncbi:T9SS type A sorting domain-containing protein [Pontibacter sp. BT310]|uniref:T9SS type A sorting domain-containing protein n=1 Tax=Pontibacter populi TaxID=890055 RepID=A0ABS6XFK7_9BACT|nr:MULTISPECIES: T9SS type A sorting domain-containing protein [Pontibacter]MBJ6119839.1 T9SS type A sorting domain-containing protein [Pontibacter sp. BT310]MBR0572268.1 T9SS type A sorting domain-containing protein [Microvirga sp. STS03]MBW3366692.1 T9SS type A sorting domain-containing protein [Pontibacter populi]
MKKKFTLPIILSCLLFCALTPDSVFAQTDQVDPQDCFYISEDECYAIGYVSVTQRPKQPGGPQNDQLDVELFFQDICETITEITISQVQGPLITIPDDQITSTLNTVVFQVNVNSFKDGILRVTIESGENKKIVVPIHFDESLNCGIITPLPVELTSFKGKVTESGINLEWETASEINNSHFDVERSRNGKTYETIAIVKGRGTTSVASNYSFTDKLPQKGLNYYRLKQVDFDNTTSYSNTIAVTWDASETIEIALVPNPCLNGDCNIAISNAANLETLVQLKDMTGRVVYSKTVKSDRHLLELPMADLKQYKGLFFLTAATGKQVVHQRILLE